MTLEYKKPQMEIIEVEIAAGFMSAGGPIEPWIPDDDVLE